MEDHSLPREHKSLSGRDVLVTGATGFIGRHLVRALVSAGARVRILARLISNLDALRDVMDCVEIHPGDLRDAQSLKQAVRGQEIVFHLANATGPDWEEIRRASVCGTESLLEAAARAGVCHFGHPSKYRSVICKPHTSH